MSLCKLQHKYVIYVTHFIIPMKTIYICIYIVSIHDVCSYKRCYIESSDMYVLYTTCYSPESNKPIKVSNCTTRL